MPTYINQINSGSHMQYIQDIHLWVIETTPNTTTDLKRQK